MCNGSSGSAACVGCCRHLADACSHQPNLTWRPYTYCCCTFPPSQSHTSQPQATVFCVMAHMGGLSAHFLACLHAQIGPARPILGGSDDSVEKLCERFSTLLAAFDGHPWTLQRLCELVLEPQKQYKRLSKLVRLSITRPSARCCKQTGFLVCGFCSTAECHSICLKLAVAVIRGSLSGGHSIIARHFQCVWLPCVTMCDRPLPSRSCFWSLAS